MDIPLASTSRIEKKPELVEALKKVLPASSIIEDKAETLAYECDALTAYRCPPMLVVLPCLLYTSPSPRDMRRSRMPSSA